MEDLLTPPTTSEQCITTSPAPSHNSTSNNSHNLDTMGTTHLDAADSIFTEELEPVTLEPHLLPPLPRRMKTRSQKDKTEKLRTPKPKLTSTPVKSQKATSSPRKMMVSSDKVPFNVYTCVESSEIPLDLETYQSPVSEKGSRGLSSPSPLKDIYNTIGCSRLGKKSGEKEKIKNRVEVPSSAELTSPKTETCKKKRSAHARQGSSDRGASFNNTVIVDEEISFKNVSTPKSRLDQPIKDCEVRIMKVEMVKSESGVLKTQSKEPDVQSCDRPVGLRSTVRRRVKHKANDSVDNITPSVVPRCSTPPPSPHTPLGDESPLSLSSYDEVDTSYDTPPERDSSLEDYRPPRRIPTPKFDGGSRSFESEDLDTRVPVRATRRTRQHRRPRGATTLKYPTSSSGETSPHAGTNVDPQAVALSSRTLDIQGTKSSHLKLTRVDEDDPVYQDFIALLTTAECMLLKCQAAEKKLRSMQKQKIQGNNSDDLDPFDLYSMTLSPAMTSAEMHIQTARGMSDIRKANKILKKQIRLLTKVHCQAERTLTEESKAIEELGSSTLEKTLESYVPEKVWEFIHPQMVVTGLFGCIAIGVLLYVYQF